ncbi:MAG: NgoFVII family restriction endonuclease [Bdellovibrionales bacterium]|nr:NgoFVII family restriction endonuclease [Bdellovibrionales bacterium]
MPKIYDNQRVSILSGLSDALDRSHRSDICTAYFNLRGWKKIAGFIDKYKGGEENQCRLLLGMYSPEWHLRKEILQVEEIWEADNKKARNLRREALRKFKKQLTMGMPSNEDEKALRNLAHQIKEKKVIVKCFTRHPLHAKLYLTFNQTEFARKIGFLGSSNLTYAGLEKNGELNIDVLDQESCEKLSQWFDEKWLDQFSVDISREIIKLIEESWAGEELLLPYHIYMKMAYHLSEDARKGLTDFYIPKKLKKKLFDFQSAAVRIATRYVYHRGGVLIGDVVGLGKTLMAIAVAKILEEEFGWQNLILCPKNLEAMWNEYIDNWEIRGRVIPISQVQSKLPELARYHVVIIDESHNLRNPHGKRYQAVKNYILKNDSKCILLSATPYNKTYKDLSSQLGLFIDSDADLGVRPNKYLREEEKHFEGLTSSLKAFEESPYFEDWQQLMSQFLVRRTRSFIKNNYGKKSESGRYYIEKTKGEKNFFPERVVKTISYEVDKQYKNLFSEEVVDMISGLKLARYDLNRYKKKNLKELSKEEKELFKDLERSRAHPKGFCRINLFKRLESSGFSFLQSVQRHILRNCIFIYAFENKQDLIIGEKGGEVIAGIFEDKEGGMIGFSEENEEASWFFTDYDSFYEKAKEAYKKYKEKNSPSLRWISSSYFTDKLREDLKKDTDQFISLLEKSKKWNPEKDLKLKRLEDLLKNDTEQKVLIFTQSKETGEYLTKELQKRKLKKLELITGGMSNTQSIIKRFSPISNKVQRDKIDVKESEESEIDILITTDVLSEGQNLQDCNTVINYDLPWAVIKLIQRVGRIDRIGQESDKIFCYSFMPDKDLERQINLRSRIQKRLRENAEVIGTDEQFFENEKQVLMDLYNENSEALEKEMIDDIDLSSFALEIWNKGIKKDPELEKKVKNMPDVVHSSKEIKKEDQFEGVLLFAKSHINNYLLYLNEKGESIKEDQMSLLKIAECQPNTKALKRSEKHYEIVKSGLDYIHESSIKFRLSNRLGTSRNPRRKIFEKLEAIPNKNDEEEKIMEDIHHYPLSNESENTLKRMFKRKLSDKEILNLVKEKHRSETLVNKKEVKKIDERPRIICSMGLVKKA